MSNSFLELYGCQAIGIKIGIYLFFIVCNFFAFLFISDLGSDCFILVWLLCFISLVPLSWHRHPTYLFGILTHSLCLNFTFIFEYSTHQSSVLGRHVFNQSLLVFGILCFVLDTSDLTFACPVGFRHVGPTTSPSCFVLWCFYVCLAMLRLFRIPAGYSPHTSISTLHVRSSLFSPVLHSGLGVFFGGAEDTDNNEEAKSHPRE